MEEEKETQEIRLGSLRLFEVVLLFKFLPAREKMCSLGVLSKAWRNFVHRHYVWHSLPI